MARGRREVEEKGREEGLERKGGSLGVASTGFRA